MLKRPNSSKIWCRRPELNRHAPFGARDFKCRTPCNPLQRTATKFLKLFALHRRQISDCRTPFPEKWGSNGETLVLRQAIKIFPLNKTPGISYPSRLSNLLKDKTISRAFPFLPQYTLGLSHLTHSRYIASRQSETTGQRLSSPPLWY